MGDRGVIASQTGDAYGVIETTHFGVRGGQGPEGLAPQAAAQESQDLLAGGALVGALGEQPGQEPLQLGMPAPSGPGLASRGLRDVLDPRLKI